MNVLNSRQRRYPFRLLLLHPRHWLTWAGLACFLILTLLPLSIIDRLSVCLGSVVAKKNKKRTNIVKVNFSLCFPEKSSVEIDQMVNDYFRAQYRSLVHYFILWWRPLSSVRKKIKTSGFERVSQYQKQGKKIIILLTHNVGLEFAVASISMNYKMSGPYKAMKNPVINWMVARGRMRLGEKQGVDLFTREDGLRPLIRAARADKILVYLADEDLGRKSSVFVPFYGVKKATIPVLGRLAKACDAVVLPCTCCYDPKSKCYTVKLLPKIEGLPSGDDEKDSLNMNKAIEQIINLCPTQYLWTLRYFKTRPQGEAAVYD